MSRSVRYAVKHEESGINIYDEDDGTSSPIATVHTSVVDARLIADALNIVQAQKALNDITRKVYGIRS